MMHDDTSTTEANMAEMNDTDDSTEETYLRKTVFYVLIDNVVIRLTVHFNAADIFVSKKKFIGEICHNV